MLKTEKFIRRPFIVDAVRITDVNMKDVAKWCGGRVQTKAGNKKYIKVEVRNPLSPRQSEGYVGDWVLYSGKGFKVYTDSAFTATFESGFQEALI